jgi:membrane protease YdiL (CAAX protease family)
VLQELVVLWLVTLLLIRGVLTAQSGLGLPDWVRAAVPLLFMYAPIALCRWRGADSWAYRLSIPALSDGRAWREVLLLNLRVVGVIAVPFVIGYHYYQSLLFGHHPGHGSPPQPWLEIAHHLFFVAVPEEFFYRGYFQTRLNEVFQRKFLIFGVPMGWSAPLACLFFAFGHSVVTFQWWHFATFFPGLAFAWMRERSGGIMSGALFHAICNVGVVFLDYSYGLR